jgi:polysaccharide pyruvyl transferase WcaK-like protein
LGLQNVQLAADAAFLVSPDRQSSSRRVLREAGVDGPFMVVFLGEKVSEADPEYTIDLLRSVQESTQHSLLLCTEGVKDICHAEDVTRELDIPVIGVDVEPETLITILSQASLVLSGRYHCCIYAALAGTPYVPFRSNTDKIEGLGELLDWPVSVVDYASSSVEEVCQLAAEVLADSQDLVAVLAKGASKARRLARRTVASMEALK